MLRVTCCMLRVFTGMHYVSFGLFYFEYNGFPLKTAFSENMQHVTCNILLNPNARVYNGIQKIHQ
jgi:hypothetical protein